MNESGSTPVNAKAAKLATITCFAVFARFAFDVMTR